MQLINSVNMHMRSVAAVTSGFVLISILEVSNMQLRLEKIKIEYMIFFWLTVLIILIYFKALTFLLTV